MSRRPADKAAQNQQVIKNLLRLEGNKTCADCKRNKHPRWASWNLGVFICIRCSGIHRGMGTHISRVKSVDLDAWTDEQLQSIMKWGNARANRYWESKLAPGHVPSDGKIENFIRTKYESRRWVMEGPMPDPSTLGGDGDEDVPLTTVQERAKMDRSASQRVSSTSSQPAAQMRGSHAQRSAAAFSLIDGGDEVPMPPRASTTEPSTNVRPPPPRNPAQPSQLLGGLDFLSGPPERPSSTNSGPGSMTRPDLKQSILSLYASKPAPQQTLQQPQTHPGQDSPSKASAAGGDSSFGGLNDAFGSLSFTTGPAQNSKPSTAPQIQPSKPTFSMAPKSQPAKPDAYAALTGVLSNQQSYAPASQVSSPPAFSGGNFFNGGAKATKTVTSTPKVAAAPPLTTQTPTDDWGDFSIANDASISTSKGSQAQVSSPNNNLLDFTSGAAANFSAPAATQKPTSTESSIFNLSSSKPVPSTPAATASNTMAQFPSDPWGQNEWTTSAPTPTTDRLPAATAANAPKTGPSDFGWSAPSDWGSSTTISAPATKGPVFDAGGWDDPAPTPPAAGFGAINNASIVPKVQPEEDFGGWGEPTAAPARSEPPRQQTVTANTSGQVSSNSDDLFANVWG